MISIRNLTKYYDTNRAVDALSVEINAGQILGLLGPNGAGKTTTMRILTGYLSPTSGTIQVKDLDVVEDPLEVKQLIGYLPESAPLYPDMLNYDYLAYVAAVHGIPGKKIRSRIEELVELLVNAGAIEKKAKSKLIEVLMAREALGSTAIGQGIAIPHGKSEAVNTLIASLGVSKKGIDFDSLDGEPAFIFFLLVAPVDSAGPHLKALARISRLLKDKYFRDKLKTAKDNQAILEFISQEDKRVG
jgi:mannitol/fructose-specific phosphotransferase system IIA component (Ntr-type)